VNHYEVLGVAPDVPTPVIRAAFVALARRHHPDRHATESAAVQSDAERRMRTINDAWAVLSDAGRRASYDRELGLVPDPDSFRPIEADEPGDVDPRAEPDAPYRRAPEREVRQTRLATLVPVVLFGLSVAVLLLGLVLAIPALLGIGVVVFLLSCASFVIVPLLVLSRATRDEG